MILINSCEKDEGTARTARSMFFTSNINKSVNKIDLTKIPYLITILYDDADGITGPKGLALTNDGYILICDTYNDCILKMPKSGTGPVEVIYDNDDRISSPTLIAVDNNTGFIYWCNAGTNQVMKGKSDGSFVPVALYARDSVIRSACGMAIDNVDGKIYLSDNRLGIMVGNLDGSGTPNVLFNSVNNPEIKTPYGICMNPETNTIYWTDIGGHKIFAAKLTENSTPLILYDRYDGVTSPAGICLDNQAGKLYWYECFADNIIAKGDLDGSGIREVIVENPHADHLILDFE
ncbi:MAG: hypothetical protein JW723_03875 [Bacteroidales bacterium]|nr:hypothetical protein [Bacteroidales bacterium]